LLGETGGIQLLVEKGSGMEYVAMWPLLITGVEKQQKRMWLMTAQDLKPPAGSSP
jgi:hypothetical protein